MSCSTISPPPRRSASARPWRSHAARWYGAPSTWPRDRRPTRSWRRLKRPGEDARPTRRRALRQRSHRHPSSARHVHGAQQGGKARWPAQVALRQRSAARSSCIGRGKQDGGDVQARLAARPRVCGRRGLRYPRGRSWMRQVRARHAAASSDAEAGAASSPPPGRPPTGASPLGGAAQRASGAGAGSPDAHTQSRTTGCASGAEDVTQLARRARGRHRRRSRRGACPELLGALSG